MSRFLIAWELGANYGHLSRDLPVAKKLRDAGQQLLFAVRDTRVAAELLRPHRFDYVQAPACVMRTRLPRPPLDYAEMLAAEGWRDRVALLGHVQAWLTTIRLGAFDAVIADHAPGALLAAHIADIVRIPLGSGFEIPPAMRPMPTIRPWENPSVAALLDAEQQLLAEIDAIVAELHGKPLRSLGELFPDHALLTTFPELDHYPDRGAANYVGSIHGIEHAPELSAPGGREFRVVAYLRAHHRSTAAALMGIKTFGMHALGVIPDASPEFKAGFQSASLTLIDRPVAIAPLLTTAQVVVCHANAGFAAAALLGGAPLLMLPTTVEHYLCAKRVEAMGAGIVLERTVSPDAVQSALQRLRGEARFKSAAQAFALRHRESSPDQAATLAAARIIQLATKAHG